MREGRESPASPREGQAEGSRYAEKRGALSAPLFSSGRERRQQRKAAIRIRNAPRVVPDGDRRHQRGGIR